MTQGAKYISRPGNQNPNLDRYSSGVINIFSQTMRWSFLDTSLLCEASSTTQWEQGVRSTVLLWGPSDLKLLFSRTPGPRAPQGLHKSGSQRASLLSFMVALHPQSAGGSHRSMTLVPTPSRIKSEKSQGGAASQDKGLRSEPFLLNAVLAKF